MDKTYDSLLRGIKKAYEIILTDDFEFDEPLAQRGADLQTTWILDVLTDCVPELEEDK